MLKTLFLRTILQLYYRNNSKSSKATIDSFEFGTERNSFDTLIDFQYNFKT